MRTSFAPLLLIGFASIRIATHAADAVFDAGPGELLVVLDPSQITGTNRVVKNGEGTLQVAGSSNYTGSLVINAGEVRVEGDKTNVDSFASSGRLRGLSGKRGILTFAYKDAMQRDRIVRDQPMVGSGIKLGFDSVTRSDHSYGLGAAADDLQNYAGLVIRGGQVYFQTSQTFVGDGTAPTTVDLDGGELQTFGGAMPATLTFSGKITVRGGTLNGGGYGGAKGTLVTSGDVEIRAGSTITGLPNLTLQPSVGTTNHLMGTAILPKFYTLAKEGPGTAQIDSIVTAANLVDVRSGTLLLGKANAIAGLSAIRLWGGATLATGGFNEELGPLVLAGNSTIDLGQGASILVFEDSSVIAWHKASTLAIVNWSGNFAGFGLDQVYFGQSSRGLTETQLSQIAFVDPEGFSPGRYGAEITASGEVRPVPIPPLRYTLSGSSLSLLWPLGYMLQSAPQLKPDAWSDVSAASPALISISKETPKIFFRLIKR